MTTNAAAVCVAANLAAHPPHIRARIPLAPSIGAGCFGVGKRGNRTDTPDDPEHAAALQMIDKLWLEVVNCETMRKFMH